MAADLKVIDDIEPVSASVLRRLDQVRELAVQGKVSSVIISTVDRDGNTSHSWSEIHNFSLMIGGLMRAMDALLARQRESDD